MNSVPYLWVYILFVTVTTTSLVLFGIARYSKSAGMTEQRIRRIVWSAATLLFGWMGLSMLLGWLGVFRGGPDQKVPLIAFGIVIPTIIGIWLIWRSATVREILCAVPQSSLVGVQCYRGVGAIFLILYGQKLLPSAFALLSGFGDVTVGLAALLVAAVYASGASSRVWAVAAWNVLGITDFVVAITVGFLSVPDPLQKLAFNDPAILIGAFPLVMIPIFAVPVSVFLHAGSLTKLSWGEEKKPLSASSGNWRQALSAAAGN
jgi:hypothetical protein